MYIKNSKQYEIYPIDNRQSFYGKAWVEENLNTGTKYLYSYGTLVARLNKDGKLTRCWGGWSATTSRHVDSFVGRKMSKREWESLPVVRVH